MDADKKRNTVFPLVGRDPYSWIMRANRLKLSADTLLPHLIQAMQSRLIEDGEKQLAYMESFMMLTGFSFESLIKGIDIAKNPSLVSEEELNTRIWSSRGGHGISNFARKIIHLSADELDLLERLEEHIVWAGRYPIPKTAETHSRATEERNRRRFHSDDPKLINKLFEQLSKILLEEADKLAR